MSDKAVEVDPHSGGGNAPSVVAPPGADANATGKGAVPLGSAGGWHRNPDMVSAAFRLGWLVSQLHGPLLQHPDGAAVTLPAVCNLGPADAVPVALAQIEALLGQLAGCMYGADVFSLLAPATARIAVARWQSPVSDQTGFAPAIADLHRSILCRMAVGDGVLATAYSVGRALSDTCWLAEEPADFDRLFVSTRLDVLQGGIGDIGGALADPGAGAAVSASLGRWRDWVATALPAVTGGRWVDPAEAQVVIDVLHTQSHVWFSLLAGEKTCAALLSPDSYLAAGEASLRRVGKLTRRFLAHFWPWLILIVAIVAGLVTLAVTKGRGTAKVWTSLLAVGGGLGVTWKGVDATLGRMAQTAEKSMWTLETQEASAWAATFLPPISAKRILTRHRLRRYGIAPPKTGHTGVTVA